MTRGKRVLWTPGMDLLLGTVPDLELSAKFGIHNSTIGRRRKKLGIPSFGPSKDAVEWTEEMDLFLGTIADLEVARKFRISGSSVGRRRFELGIPTFGNAGGVVWTTGMDALLGTLPDPEISDKLGICKVTILNRRFELGILSYQEQHKAQFGRSYLIRNLRNDLTYKQWKFACEWFEDRCAYCGAKVFLTEDHLVPISKGGPRTALNIIPACSSCNSSKHSYQAHLWIYKKFGMSKGKEVVDRIVAYLMEVRGT